MPSSRSASALPPLAPVWLEYCPLKLNSPRRSLSWKRLNCDQRYSPPSRMVWLPRIRFSVSRICALPLRY